MAPLVGSNGLSRKLLFLLALASGINATQYALSASYSGTNFFSHWDFAVTDPSGGWNTYVNESYAQKQGYISATAHGAYIGVDHTSTLNPSGPGRNSIRIVSKASFTKGLFIGNFSHMPTGCGLWPAFWMVGPNWPSNGEIDILEGVNNQAGDQISAHTSNGCVVAGTNAASTFYQSNCYQPDTNSGCYFISNKTHTYGAGFNSAKGGVYAVEWTDNYISVYFFTSSAIPADITNGNPNPAKWGTPLARFSGSGCNIDQHFNSMQIVINTDFCGPWAGAVYGSSGCPGSSCIDYVASTPSAFKNAYWHVNSVAIYKPASGSAAASDGVQGDAVGSADAVTPVASLRPVYAPDAAMGAVESPVLVPGKITSG